MSATATQVNSTADPIKTGMPERLLTSLGAPLWDGFFRFTMGCATALAYSVLAANRPGRIFDLFVLTVLFLLRVIPAIARKLLPFPPSVTAVWAERRQLAKRYDSYQWRKLFWFGIGLGSYATFAGRVVPSQIATVIACVLLGAIGMARWHVIARRITIAEPSGRRSLTSSSGS